MCPSLPLEDGVRPAGLDAVDLAVDPGHPTIPEQVVRDVRPVAEDRDVIRGAAQTQVDVAPERSRRQQVAAEWRPWSECHLSRPLSRSNVGVIWFHMAQAVGGYARPEEVAALRARAEAHARDRQQRLRGPGRPPSVDYPGLSGVLATYGVAVSVSQLKKVFNGIRPMPLRLLVALNEVFDARDATVVFPRWLTRASATLRRGNQTAVNADARDVQPSSADYATLAEDLRLHARWPEALEMFKWARAVTTDAVAAERLTVAIARMSSTLGMHEASVSETTRLLERADLDPIIRSDALAELGAVLRYQGRYAAAERVLDEALVLARQYGTARDQAQALHARGRTHLDRALASGARPDRSQLERAWNDLRKACKRDEALRGTTVDGHHFRYLAYVSAWHRPDAFRQLRAASAAAFGSDAGIGHVHLLDALMAQQRGDYAAMRRGAEAATEAYVELRYPQGVARALSLHARGTVPTGDAREPRQALSALDAHAAAILLYPYPPVFHTVPASGDRSSALASVRELRIVCMRRWPGMFERWISDLPARVATRDGVFGVVGSLKHQTVIELTDLTSLVS